MEKQNILIVDDHPLFRKGMISLLEKSEIIGEIFEASTLKEALQILKENKIDIITLDLNLPDEDGMKFFNYYNLPKADFKVLVITTYNTSYLVEEVLRQGAKGYLKKENLYENLLKAISCIAEGGVYLEETSCNADDKKSFEEKLARYYTLSDAEKEVFKLIAMGKSNKEIASILNKSVKTIETQKHSIMDKLKPQSSSEIIKIAVRLNIIDL